MFDAIALQAVADELRATILHGRVQEIVQLDALTFGFEIYAQHARHYLYVSVHPDDARIHLVARSAKLRGSGQPPSALFLLLRKHAENALIDSITQLPHERVLKIQFDHSVEGIATLVVETIGKYSNLILHDADGVVIDALKRVTSSMNRTRVILPRQKYIPPPPQAKFSPTELTSQDFARTLADAQRQGAPLWQTLVKTIAGVSPLLAREVEHRIFHSSVTIPEAREIMEILKELMEKPSNATVAFEDGEPIAFAPYALTQFADTRSFDSISAAIESFYGAPESYAAVKEPLRVLIAEARDKLARKHDALAKEQARANDIERLRVSGEMILAYSYQIANGQTTLVAEIENGKIEIPLNPILSVVENAQKYFRDYHRAKDAAARVPALLAAVDAEVEYAEQMLNDLEMAENRAEIDAVVQAARDAGLIVAPRQRVKLAPSEPRVFTSRDGFTILVGKNAKQNEEVTFRRANADDLWLHARNVAGAHVVIVRAGRDVPESTIEEAAKLAAQFSQARDDSRVDVIVTPRRNVHRVRGGRAGMVTVRAGQTLQVSGFKLQET